MKEKTVIQILGKEYETASDLDPLHVQARAKYVEEKLLEARANAETQSTSEIAVLAALNIADEFFNLKNEYENLLSLVDRKADDIIAVIDQNLK